MIAMVVFLCRRAAPIAASMSVLGPGSDRPAAVRPKASRRTAAAGFFVFGEECRHFAAGEKSRPSRCGKAIEALPALGPDPSIRGCVGRARERTDGDHHHHCHTSTFKDLASPIAARLAPRASTHAKARPDE